MSTFMKILYIANVRIPTEKAHGVQIMEMCNAFAKEGVEIELVVPKRNNTIAQETFSFYDLPKAFAITRLFTWDLVRFGPLGFSLQALTFMVSAFFYARKQEVLVYSREDLILFLLSFTKKKYVYEVHAPKWHFVTRRALQKASLIVSISEGLKDFYLQKGILEERILVAPDGVNLERFKISESKELCRVKLGLPQDKKIALYSGHLYERKGAHTFAEAAKLLGDEMLCVFVGGTDDDVMEFKKRYGAVENIRILGYRPHQDIPFYLKSADVLVLPNSAQDEDSALYTSPMKLFEYMASGTPIAASDVPSLREVLSDESALFVKADNPTSLCGAIEKLSHDKILAGQMSDCMLKDITQYEWDERVRHILRHIHLVALPVSS